MREPSLPELLWRINDLQKQLERTRSGAWRRLEDLYGNPYEDPFDLFELLARAVQFPWSSIEWEGVFLHGLT